MGKALASDTFCGNAGLYIHVPFCVRKCPYCDFNSVTELSLMDRTVDALVRELDIADGAWGELHFDTVYFGGGTPSLLPPQSVERVLDKARKRLSIAPDAEITLEANPGTVTLERLAAYRSLGVNRINLGVQSFSDASLRYLGRIHNADEARAALVQAREAGFERLGLDLIHGLPGQDRALFARDLEQALDFRPEHLSCYMLTLEPGTPLFLQEAGKNPDEAKQAELFLFTIKRLEEAGFLHYEVSNFARGPAHTSRHNAKYWNGAPYLGLGPGAHSFDGRVRSWNLSPVPDYLARVEAGQSPCDESETLTREQEILESLSLGLRQRKGIHIPSWENRFHLDFAETFGKTLETLRAQDLIASKTPNLALSPRGMLFLNTVVGQLAQDF